MASAAVEGCRERNARLLMFYFDQASQKLVVLEDEEGEPAFDLWLPTGHKSQVQQRQLDETLERARSVVDVAMKQTPGDARGSDIVSAVRTAAKNLNDRARADGVDERFLIVLTDGLQTTSDLSVQDLAEEASAVEPLLLKAEQLRLVPQLDGTFVNFLGVRTGVNPDGSQLPEFFEANVELFWQGLVERGGGSLCLYEPDATHIPMDC
ncbi:MAG: VWA domain-containing protein [Actinobacteria bacterium]|nr:VWA domain-containing protein [Actinomycetota bacterium]